MIANRYLVIKARELLASGGADLGEDGEKGPEFWGFWEREFWGHNGEFWGHNGEFRGHNT